MNLYGDSTPIATAAQFKAALLAVRDKVGISVADGAMLKAHFNAPNHTISTAALAKKLGYRNLSIVNGKYGRLAHRVADALHHIPPPVPSGHPHWWRTLAYGNEDTPPTSVDPYEWIMRPELVQALKELKWA